MKRAVKTLNVIHDDEMNLQKDYFPGNPEEIKKLMEAVANQGKAKCPPYDGMNQKCPLMME